MQVPDADADGLVGVLDDLGVATACVSHSIGMVSDWRLGNDLLIDAVARHPRRIFGYAFYNPRYPDEMEAELRRCADGGLRGLKIHPDFHKAPADPPLYDLLYEWAQAESRPVLCHYGQRGPYAGAQLYRGVVERFPKATYIMAHSLPGREAVDMAVEYFGRRENVLFCLANAFQPGVIKYAAGRLGVRRLLYGSDGCWGSMTRRLGLVCAADLDDEDKRRILGRNMRELVAVTPDGIV
jgi:predicted TIM-barrel fold metal-dependent hydrolase